MIEFVWWGFLLLLPLAFILRLLLQPADSVDDFALRTPYYQNWLQLYQTSDITKEKRLLRFILLSLIWIFLVLAVARPQYVGEPIELPASGRDLLLAVDISGSMEATDLKLMGKKATRLDVVKSVLNDFIDRREGDRIGLILFGEQAYLQTPLTFDRTTVKKMLDESVIGLAGASRTAIGDGIGLAVKRLRERDADSRVLVLLTDGQNNTGAVDPLKAAQLASQIGVKIYTIGVGAEEMVVESFFGQRTLNPSKDLDEKTLIQVAKTTGGQYFRAKDTIQLEEIYAVLDKIEPVESNPETFRPVKSLFYWPLAVSLIIAFLLALEKLIRFKVASRTKDELKGETTHHA
ncbi:MAG: BatB protein [Gammaproteobacteria bacterium]|nr:MAG: BatB protein [Gammaproteobacteria bacterium]